MRRLSKIVSTTLAFLLSANVFAACGGNDSSGSSPTESESSSVTHVHEFETAWSMNGTGHWHACECGERADYAKHSGGTAQCGEKAVCEICSKIYGEAGAHPYGGLTDTEDGRAFVCECGDTKLLADLADFTVEVEVGREPIILQLSDPQITDYTAAMENKCFAYIRETVEATDPDLILVTGDLTYGRFDTADGKVFSSYVRFMESLNTPWAPVFGNHDNEIEMGVDWQCQQLEEAENCLFRQRSLTGNGNYSVGVVQGDTLLRTFFMLDSNGCGSPSEASLKGKNGIKRDAGFGNDQILWYKSAMRKITAASPDTKLSMAYHIQSADFALSFQQYAEFSATLTTDGKSYKNPLNLDTLETAKDGDFGYLGRPMKGAWGEASSQHATLKQLNVDSVFVGHEHCNSVSIVHNGIRYQYGQKSSTYDRYNALTPDGKIVGGYDSEHAAGSTPLMGGTAFKLSQEDGSIVSPYIYLCGNPFGTNP